jgi:catechol 2,3-dioxygenase-like lactoylglutathione lyase family enzyme
MALARWKDFCIDAVDDAASQRFWSQALGLRLDGGPRQIRLAGERPEQVIWINQVPEAKSVKNRIHLDIVATSLDELYAIGASFVEQHPRWTVLADPDGQEFCAFVREPAELYRHSGAGGGATPSELPSKLKDLVVDSQDPERIANWWHGVLGGTLGGDPDNPWFWVSDLPGAPLESMDFVEVPEAKTIKNRVHWDLLVPDLDALVATGATLLRPAGGDIRWHVMADPDGNEFCAFTS